MRNTQLSLTEVQARHERLYVCVCSFFLSSLGVLRMLSSRINRWKLPYKPLTAMQALPVQTASFSCRLERWCTRSSISHTEPVTALRIYFEILPSDFIIRLNLYWLPCWHSTTETCRWGHCRVDIAFVVRFFFSKQPTKCQTNMVCVCFLWCLF